MKKQILTLSLIVSLFCIGCSSEKKTNQPPVKQRVKQNFSGMSFYSEDADAEQQDTWKIENGMLKCTGTPKGYLHTNDSFKNFIMTFKWRWPDPENPGKGGVLIDTTGKYKIWPKSHEAQINAGDAGDFWALDGYKVEGDPELTETVSHDQFGELIHIKKMQPAEKTAGMWNSYKIVAEEENITLFINGRLVNKAKRINSKGGIICLTAEGTPIEFKDIKIVAN